MARPAHPNSHDKRLRDILEASLHEERLVPCPDLATTKLIRSRFREIIRAHRVWNTGLYPKYRRIKTKILHTHLILPVRPEYEVDASKFPYTLSLDAREVMDDILPHVGGGPGVPLTRAPQNSAPAYSIDDDEDDEELDPYDLIASRYRKTPLAET